MNVTRSMIADKARAIPVSGIRKFFDIVSQMEDVISLGVGEPDFVTPWRIREAAIYAIEQGYTTYTSNYGLLELREAISRRLECECLVHYNPENEILVTVGASEGIDLAMRAILNPGDEVIIPEPCFVSYKPCVILADGVPVPVACHVEDQFKPNIKQLEKAITPKTRAILISFPNNPTGIALEREDLEKIADLAHRHDLIVISDEIYEKLRYSGKHVCFSALPGMKERTILLNGLSKSHAMTGWRVGYACSTSEIIDAMMKIHQYGIMCASIVSQKSALEALDNCHDEVQKMVDEYDLRRRLMVSRLNEMGLECVDPQGAFYVFPCIKSTGLSSEQFAEKLLMEEKVAVVPGNAFGDCGEGYIRCSYATSAKNLEEALHRINRFIDNLKKS